MGLAAASTAAIAPESGPPIVRAATNVNQTSIAPATGVRMNIASRPPTMINGASSTEKPGAHTGTDSEGSASDVTKPPGVNVFGASGQGTRVASSLAGCNRKDANASAMSA